MKISRGQERQIRDGIQELQKLSTLKTAHFSSDEAENERIKKEIRVWASWINVYATKIKEGMDNNLWDGYYYNE